MNARDFMNYCNDLEKANKRLVGDITHGYYYMDTDKAFELQKKINQQLKKEGAVMGETEMKKVQVGSDKDHVWIDGERFVSFRRFRDLKIELMALRVRLSTMVNTFYGVPDSLKNGIKNVVFNNPATIVFWTDGTKTVVKCGKDEEFDPEKGLAMAISKRFLGDKGNYYEVFKKWLSEKETTQVSEDIKEKIKDAGNAFVRGIKDAIGTVESMRLPFIDDSKAEKKNTKHCG